MKNGDPKVSGCQCRFQLKSSLSKRLCHIASPKHSWLSFSSAVNVSFCWILSEINWKCCVVISPPLQKRWPTCNTWTECHSSTFVLLRSPSCPAAGLWGDRPLCIWGEDTCVLHVSAEVQLL